MFSYVADKLPMELQQIIHAVAASLCPPSIEIPLVEGTVLFNRETSYNTTTEVEDAMPPVSFNLPISLIKQLLELAHRTQLLTTLFLNTHLKRLNDLSPQHLAKPGFVFTSYPFRKYPEGKKYAPMKNGPATWVEEYRVIRALWRLQLFCLLTKPNTRVTPRTHEEAAYLECCIPARQDEFSNYFSHLTSWEIDEILCVQDYLESARISMRAPPSTSHDADNSSYSTSGSNQTNSSPSTPSSSSATPPVFPVPAASRFNSPPSPFQRHHDLIAIKRSTEAYNFFHRYGLRQPTSPLQRSNWSNFRRLGFGIWDQERMCQMELFRLPAAIRDEAGRSDLSIDDVAFTWKSVEEAGESVATGDASLDSLNGLSKRDRIGLGSKDGWGNRPSPKERKDGLIGWRGLMRSKTKAAGNGNMSDGSSPRTSEEIGRVRPW